MGLGSGVGLGDFSLVGLRFSDFVGVFAGVGVLAGNFNGFGVLAGDGFGDTVTWTLDDLDFSRVRCCDSGRLVSVGNGIIVGSSIASGDLAGVGVTVGGAVRAGVGAPSGNSKRPRRCDIDDEGDAGEIGVGVATGAGVCARDVANSPMIRADNARHFCMPSQRPLA